MGLAAVAGTGSPPPPPRIEARAHILLDVNSGQVLAASNPDRRLEPASLTKLMLAYVVLDALKKREISPDKKFSVPDSAVRAEGSRMFAKAGQEISVDALLTALIVQSANDGALTLAEGLSGSEAAMVERMNAQAKKLGLAATRFNNVTGLPAPGHISTARDLTELAASLAADFPEAYRRYFAQREYSFNGIAQQNRNRLLWLDPEVDGIKTGHTQSAGYCLIASAERGGRRLIATVMGARSEADRALYAHKLLNYGFIETESMRLYRARQAVMTLPVYKGKQNDLAIGFLQDFSLTVGKGDGPRLKAQVLSTQPVLAPISKGQVMGTLRMTLDGKLLGDYPLVALENVPVAGWFGRFWDSLRLLWK